MPNSERVNSELLQLVRYFEEAGLPDRSAAWERRIEDSPPANGLPGDKSRAQRSRPPLVPFVGALFNGSRGKSHFRRHLDPGSGRTTGTALASLNRSPDFWRDGFFSRAHKIR